MNLDERLLRLLEGIDVVPRRLLLDTGAVRATTSMLRGVWGRALKTTDPEAYAAVFAGRRPDPLPGAVRTPLYLMRPAPPDPDFAPALDWILFGAAIRHEKALVKAWDIAARLGLGPDREPLRIRQVRWLRCNGAAGAPPQRWSLRQAAEADRDRIAGGRPLRIHFPASLRLMRRGRLIDAPAARDIAVALLRRVLLFTDHDAVTREAELMPKVLAAADRLRTEVWRGERRDFARWSGAQHREVEMRGVTGSITFPAGAGALWPLLAAGSWTHLGKGTVFGLGELRILT